MCCYADPESVARGFEAPPTATKYQQFRGCAPVHSDENSYHDYRDRYRTMATSLGFEGHMKWAEAMP
jgi:hypothetical protein